MNPLNLVKQIIQIDLFEAYQHVDDLLVAAGWPATSPFWLESLERFWGKGCRRLVASVGRRGGKSSTMCRVAVTELLFGSFDITPGDVGVFAIFSVRMKEAEQRLRTISDILTVLGIVHTKTQTEIKFSNRPFIIRVYPAHARFAVGYTCVFLLCDEVARWRDDETGANPATQVLASIRPAMATQPNAHEFLISSPWSTTDAHWDAMQEGENDNQTVCHAPSWVANPTLTEEGTKADEPDEQTWLREYAAQAMTATEERLFSPDLLAQCIEHIDLPRNPEPGDQVVCGADWGFSRNSSALVVCHISLLGVYHVAELMVIAPKPGMPLKPSEVAAEATHTMKSHGATVCLADVHYREAMDEHLRKDGCHQAPAPVKDVATQYIRMRSLMAKGLLKLPAHQSLIRDLTDTKVVPKSGGGLKVILPKRAGGAHADAVSALALAIYQKVGPAAVPVPMIPARTPEEIRTKQEWARKLERARNPGKWGGFGGGFNFEK